MTSFGWSFEKAVHSAPRLHKGSGPTTQHTAALAAALHGDDPATTTSSDQPGPSRSEKKHPAKLHIAGLSRTQVPEEAERKLRDMFQYFGKILRVDVMTSEEGLCRGFGFVTFDNETSCNAAKEWALVHEAKIDGRSLTIGAAYKRPAAVLHSMDAQSSRVRVTKKPKPKALVETPGTKWLYKWSEAVGEDVKVHGPYDSRTMEKWKEEGCFKAGAWCRRVDEPNAEWTPTDEIPFDLFP